MCLPKVIITAYSHRSSSWGSNSYLEPYIPWVVPLPSNSHNQDSYSFSRGSQPKPSFATIASWEGGNPIYIHIWVFPKIGVPPNHPFNRVFHYKRSILGASLFLETPLYIYTYNLFVPPFGMPSTKYGTMCKKTIFLVRVP